MAIGQAWARKGAKYIQGGSAHRAAPALAYDRAAQGWRETGVKERCTASVLTIQQSVAWPCLARDRRHRPSRRLRACQRARRRGGAAYWITMELEPDLGS
jgi:hypothetical protein